MRARSLHLITTGCQTLRETLSIVQVAEQAGVDYLHIREKERSAREIEDWIIHLSDVFPRERIIVNDRVDLAVAYHCGGVQLGHQSMRSSSASRILPAHQLLGCSVHNEQECLAVQPEMVQTSLHQDSLIGNDSLQSRFPTFVLVGHIYPTECKPGVEARGLPFVTRMRALLPPCISLIGIGGINPNHVQEVMGAGADGIAVMSGIMQTTEPQNMMKAYREQLDDSFFKKDSEKPTRNKVR
ncbi:thiamine phosphate synthase [Brevibacterium sp. JNUCC-42]|nr:thiamine phosphate synthase [Brevibacterium sp. JNUCC-42]